MSELTSDTAIKDKTSCKIINIIVKTLRSVLFWDAGNSDLKLAGLGIPAAVTLRALRLKFGILSVLLRNAKPIFPAIMKDRTISGIDQFLFCSTIIILQSSYIPSGSIARVRIGV